MAINTNLLLQYMSGGGAAMSQGQPIAPALNEITQQSIANQSYAGLLKQILGGGGKVTMDKDKFNITGPSTVFGEQGANPVASGDPTSQGFGGTPQGQIQRPTVPTSANIPAPTEANNTNLGSLGLLQQLLNPQAAL